MGRIQDQSGNDNDLDLIGFAAPAPFATGSIPTLVANTFGAAFGNALDSPGNVATIDNRAGSGARCRRGRIDVGTGPFTFECYVQFDVFGATEMIAAAWDSNVAANCDWYFYKTGPDILTLLVMQDNGAGITLADTVIMTAATKYYVGFVVDTATTPPTLRLFKGLATDATIPQVASVQMAAGRTKRTTPSGAIFYLGREENQGSVFLNGRLDHAVLWDSAKYGAAGFARPTAPYTHVGGDGMLGYWNMEEIVGRASRDRFLKATPTTLGDLTTASAAANTASVISFIALGTVSLGRWKAGVAGVTVAGGLPAVGTAPTNQGWRDSAAQDAINPTEIHGASWRLRFRYKRGGTALGELDQAAIITAIVYQVSSSGTFIAELGRNASGVVTFTTTTQTSDVWIGPVPPVAMAVGDKIQVEVYVTTGTFALGVFTQAAPLTNEDLVLVLNESDANNGTAFTPQTSFKTVAAKSISETTATQPAVDVITRAVGQGRTASETLTTADSPTRRFVGARTTAESVGVAAVVATRIYGAVRSIAESVGVAADSVARIFAGGRTATESVGPATDVVTRILHSFRTAAETVGAALDSITRLVQFNRAIPETQGPAADTVARALALGRTRTETVGPALDTPTRIYQGFRVIAEGSGDYPQNNGQKQITGVVRDEDTGAPVAGVTCYLIRQAGLLYTGRSTVTDAFGVYTFLRDSGDANTYFVLMSTDGATPPRHGVSDPGLTPSVV